ncbi:MAG: protein translocase subunit SecF [Dehalococcoidia bacterium]|nr:protein translocase subunit SecF [Dehalococcoidia bacterium]
MLDIAGKRGWYFLVSALIILPGLISLIYPPGWLSLESGLNAGIDFTSGSVLNMTFEDRIDEADIQARMDELGYPEALIQKIGSRSVFIRTKLLDDEDSSDRGPFRPECIEDGRSERQCIQDDLDKFVGAVESVDFASISPIIARETVKNAFYAMLAASVVIMLYIWYAFRKVPKAYRYGFSAILALVHDVLFVLGVFSILGRVVNMEVNSMFIVGLLIVAGYSVNDTIVVFDRIRENVMRHPDRPLAGLVNLSILDTMGRSLNTSFTTLFVLLAMLLIGGPSIQGMLLVVALGAVVGTYSSVFIASQFLIIWDHGEIGKLLRRGRRGPAAAAAGLLHLIGR